MADRHGDNEKNKRIRDALILAFGIVVLFAGMAAVFSLLGNWIVRLKG